jgi:hypothetical protein
MHRGVPQIEIYRDDATPGNREGTRELGCRLCLPLAGVRARNENGGTIEIRERDLDVGAQEPVGLLALAARLESAPAPQ